MLYSGKGKIFIILSALGEKIRRNWLLNLLIYRYNPITITKSFF